MSTPQGPQNPQGPGSYPDPLQDHIPGQGGDRVTGQPGPAGGQQAYPSYPQGSGCQQGGYQQSGGYQQGGYPPGPGYPPGGGYPGGGASGYLAGAPAGFAEAARGAFGNVFTYRGRASRSAFWWFALLEIIAYVVVGILSSRSTVAGVILDIVIGIPMILTGISLSVRRLHDGDHTGWWWWIGLVPFFGWIVLLVFYLLPGTPGPNRYNFR